MKRAIATFITGMVLASVSLSGAAIRTTPTENHPAAHGRCFPAKLWNSGNVPLRYSPCAKILRVYEDGSVKVAVTDRDGVIRFTFGHGAEDR